MDPYMLGWPGLPFLPVYIRHPETGKMYWRQNPLQGEEFSVANNVEHRYVRLKVLLQLFPSVKRAMAEEVLKDLVREYGIKPIYFDDESRSHYVHVSALLAFLTVFPYCASFQLARGNILHFLTFYMETQCLNCGFIHRDCTCDGVPEYPAAHGNPEKMDIVAKISHLQDKCVQTDPAELFCPIPPPPPLSAIQNGQLIPTTAPTLQNTSCNNTFPLPPPLSMPPTTGSMQMPLWLPPGMKLNPGDRIPLSCMPGGQGQMLLRPQGAPWTGLSSQPFQTLPGMPFHMPTVGPNNFAVPQPLNMNCPMSLPQVLDQTPPLLQAQPPMRASMTSAPISSSESSSVSVKSPRKIHPNILKPNTAASPKESSKKHLSVLKGTAKVVELQKSSTSSKGGNNSGNKLDIKKNVVKTKYVKEITVGSDGKDKVTWVLKPVTYTGPETDVSRRRKRQVRPVHKTDSNFRLLSKEELKKSPRKKKMNKKADKEKTGSVVPKDLSVVQNKNGNMPNKAQESPTDGGDKCGNGVEPDEDKSQASENRDKKGAIQTESETSPVIDTKIGSSSVSERDKCIVEGDTSKCKDPDTGVVKVSDDDGKEISKDNQLVTYLLGKNMEEKSSPKVSGEMVKLSAGSEEGEKDCGVKTESQGSAVGESDEVAKDSSQVDEVASEDSIKSDDSKAKILGKPEVSHPNKSQIEDLVASECHINAEENGSLSGEEDDFGRPKKTYAKFEFLPTGDRMLRCILYTCGQCFDTEAVARVHTKVHGYDCPNQCQCYKCDYGGTLNQSADMLRHLWETHGERYVDVRDGQVPCKLCGLTFETKEKFDNHEMFHYYNRYKCVFCGCMLYTWKQVQQHLEKCLERDKGQVYHHCPYCLLSFRDEPIRIAHVKSHQDKGLICMACKDEKVWDSWKLLKSHYTMFHLDIAPKRIFRCSKCPMTFTAQKTFRKHVKKHELNEKAKPGKKTKAKLLDHVDSGSETDEKKENKPTKKESTECPKCKKKFKASQNLQRHIDFVHGDEAKCAKCDFLAKSKMLLRVHQMTKHADRRHLCADCGKTFTYYHQYRIHMTTHSHSRKQLQVKCKSCDRQFENQSELRQHMFKDHPLPGNKVLRKCTMCDYRCYSRTTLKVHLKRDHPSECEEEDTADHSYFNKKLPPPPPRRRRRSSGRGRGYRGRTRGLGRGMGRSQGGIDRTAIKKRRLNREQRRVIKERVLVRKATCARVRSMKQHEEQKEEEKGIGFQVSLQGGRAAGPGPWKTGLGVLSRENSIERPDSPFSDHEMETIPKKRGPRIFTSSGRGRKPRPSTSAIESRKKETSESMVKQEMLKLETSSDDLGLRRSGRERKQTEKGFDFFMKKRRRSRYIDEEDEEEQDYKPPKNTYRKRSHPEVSKQLSEEVSPKRPRQVKEKRSRSLSENKELPVLIEELPPVIIEEEIRPVTIENIPIALIDHTYFRTTTMEKEVRVKERGRPRKISEAEFGLQLVETPDVGEFEECQTVENISLQPTAKTLPPRRVDVLSPSSSRFTHIQIRGNRIVTPGSPEKGICLITAAAQERSPVAQSSVYGDLNRDLSDQAVLEEILPAINELISEEQVESLMSENIDSMLGHDLTANVVSSFASPPSVSRSLLSQSGLAASSNRVGNSDQAVVIATNSVPAKTSVLGPELDDIELLEADYQLWQQDHEVATETVPAEVENNDLPQSLVSDPVVEPNPESVSDLNNSPVKEPHNKTHSTPSAPGIPSGTVMSLDDLQTDSNVSTSSHKENKDVTLLTSGIEQAVVAAADNNCEGDSSVTVKNVNFDKDVKVSISADSDTEESPTPCKEPNEIRVVVEKMHSATSSGLNDVGKEWVSDHQYF